MVSLKTEKENLEVLSFTLNEAKELEWEDQKEFKFEGKMYDVVSAEYKNGYLIYYCWKDDFENELSGKINDLITYLLGTDHQEQNKKEHFTKLGNSLICQPIPKIILENNSREFEQIISTDPFWYSFKTGTPSPPPEIG
ncbi:MAG: hypothetical protein R2780_08415 [Crocinitomicaceae bacterium]